MNDANETALNLARRAEPESRGRLRAWTVTSVGGYPALINLSYIKEGDIAAVAIWIDHHCLADLDMVAGYMNHQAGVSNTMAEGLMSVYGKRARLNSILTKTPGSEPVCGTNAVH